jgi:hypothetical protein
MNMEPNEPRTFDGEWWSPRIPGLKVLGRLEITPDRISLRLHQPLRAGSLFADEEPILYGDCLSESITLRECLGGGLGDFVATSAWIGVHVREFLASQLTVRIEHLEEWAAFGETDPFTPAASTSGARIEYARPPRLEASVNDAVFRLGWNYSMKHSAKGLNLNQQAYIEWTFAQPESYDRVDRIYLRPTHNLLTLALARPVAIVELQVNVPMAALFDGRRSREATVVVPWLVTPETTSRELWPDQFTFRLGDLRTDLSGSLGAWLQAHDQLPGAFDLFFGNHYAPPRFLETRFLVHVQAAEALHVGRFGGRRLAPADGFAPPGALSKKRRRPLRERLLELVKLSPAIVRETIGDADTFAEIVSQFRNEWAHGQTASEELIAQAFARDEQLRLLLHAHLMRELGLSDDVIEARLRESRLLREVRHVGAQIKQPGNADR